MKINEFGLKDIQSFEGKEGEGLNAKLTYKNKIIADINDYGDGGQISVMWKGDEKQEEVLNSTMKKIVLSSRNLILSSISRTDSARYMAELLFELYNIERDALKSYKEKFPEKKWLGITILNNSWMTPLIVSDFDQTVKVDSVDDNIDFYVKQTDQAYETLKKDFENIVGFILTKKNTLDFTVDEYIKIFQPFYPQHTYSLTESGKETGFMIGQPIDGYTCNPLKYEVDNNENILLFDTAAKAYDYLKSIGVTEQSIRKYKGTYHAKCPQCGTFFDSRDFNIFEEKTVQNCTHNVCGTKSL